MWRYPTRRWAASEETSSHYIPHCCMGRTQGHAHRTPGTDNIIIWLEDTTWWLIVNQLSILTLRNTTTWLLDLRICLPALPDSSRITFASRHHLIPSPSYNYFLLSFLPTSPSPPPVTCPGVSSHFHRGCCLSRHSCRRSSHLHHGSLPTHCTHVWGIR